MLIFGRAAGFLPPSQITYISVSNSSGTDRVAVVDNVAPSDATDQILAPSPLANSQWHSHRITWNGTSFAYIQNGVEIGTVVPSTVQHKFESIYKIYTQSGAGSFRGIFFINGLFPTGSITYS